MRPIKFRAWHTLAKKMARIEMLDFVIDTYMATAFDGIASGSGHLADIELMQFTGLLDRNGRDIYEGDIVRDETHSYLPWKVIWCDGKGENFGNQLGWMLDDGSHLEPLRAHVDEADKEEYGNMEIIGNIYENSDLLKEE